MTTQTVAMKAILIQLSEEEAQAAVDLAAAQYRSRRAWLRLAVQAAIAAQTKGNRKGESASWSKLTTSAVREIRTSILPNQALAKRFRVTPSNISHIKHHDTWEEV